jgi:hypothetical protein
MKDEKLIKNLHSLKVSVDRSVSFKRTFLLGIVRGIGVVIGATLLAGLVLGWLASTFDTASSIPFVGPYFNDISQMLEGTSTPAN